MNIHFQSIFQPSLTSPLSNSDFQKGALVISPLFFLSFFYLPALFVFAIFLTLLSSRRLADLLGIEFYESTRALAAWLLLAGLFSIPFIGMPLVIWILCTWDRMRVREFLRDFFEVAELI